MNNIPPVSQLLVDHQLIDTLWDDVGSRRIIQCLGFSCVHSARYVAINMSLMYPGVGCHHNLRSE